MDAEERIYVHEEFLCINKDGKIMSIRLSFDEHTVFIRSACILINSVDLAGEHFYKYKNIKNIKLCTGKDDEEIFY